MFQEFPPLPFVFLSPTERFVRTGRCNKAVCRCAVCSLSQRIDDSSCHRVGIATVEANSRLGKDENRTTS
jgi:hypothetical protein